MGNVSKEYIGMSRTRNKKQKIAVNKQLNIYNTIKNLVPWLASIFLTIKYKINNIITKKSKLKGSSVPTKRLVMNVWYVNLYTNPCKLKDKYSGIP